MRTFPISFCVCSSIYFVRNVDYLYFLQNKLNYIRKKIGKLALNWPLRLA